MMRAGGVTVATPARDPSRHAVKYRGRDFVGEAATFAHEANCSKFMEDSADFIRATDRGTAFAIGAFTYDYSCQYR
jgi:hypothetical protein